MLARRRQAERPGCQFSCCFGEPYSVSGVHTCNGRRLPTKHGQLFETLHKLVENFILVSSKDRFVGLYSNLFTCIHKLLLYQSEEELACGLSGSSGKALAVHS